MVKLEFIKNNVVIELVNAQGKIVYMQFPQRVVSDSLLAFVEVDILRRLWSRNQWDKRSHYANACEDVLRQDYKFHYAEEGFSHGKCNPVPVARIGILYFEDLPYVGFSNGITRTIWLIANDFKIIPFEVLNATREFMCMKGVYNLAHLRK